MRARALRGLRLTAAAVVVLAGCRSFLDLEDGTPQDAGPGPPAEAGSDDVATPDAPVTCPTYVVQNGLYSYENESFALANLERMIQLANGAEKDGGIVIENKIGPLFFATSRPVDAGTSFRLDFNDAHFDDYTFAPGSADSGLRVVNVVEDLLNFPVSVACSPPVEAVRCPMIPDASWQAAATGTYSNAAFDVRLTFQYANDEDIAVEGALIPTYHVIETRKLSGAIAGNAIVEYWFAKNTGLLIHGKVFVGDLMTSAVTGLTMTTPFGPFEYKAAYEFKIKSITPKALPIADAATDG